jgi:hypothetical protein
MLDRRVTGVASVACGSCRDSASCIGLSQSITHMLYTVRNLTLFPRSLRRYAGLHHVKSTQALAVQCKVLLSKTSVPVLDEVLHCMNIS